ncbi:hypothetical protein [Halorientalis halophila]|uniref:hypothetical protein n=1 Tax=Halorientalis halophila TaxID=3108499 RepID=UPI00300A5930
MDDIAAEFLDGVVLVRAVAILSRIGFVVAELVEDGHDPSRCGFVPVVSERVQVGGLVVGAVRGVGLPVVGVLADAGEFEG